MVVALMFAACGAPSRELPDSATADASADANLDASGFVEAPHGNAPQVLSAGGGVLATPKVVPIVFAGDSAMQSQLETFLAKLASSQYWSATTAEYGVGSLAVGATIVSTDSPPTTEAALGPWLVAHLDGTHPDWPAFNASTIYTVFLPFGVTFQSHLGTSCASFGGYHAELAGAHGEKIVYALVPRCDDIDALTRTTSHELVEAATDPLLSTNGAYQLLDSDHAIWRRKPGAELGDMCEYVPTATQPLVAGFLVQRTWSNASASAGHDPCVPMAASPYYAAVPVLNDAATFAGVPTKAVQIPLGASKVVDVVLFSDGPSADFSVTAFDVHLLTSLSTADLGFSWDKTTGHNGDTLHLTITRLQNGQGGSEFVLISGPTGSGVSTWWGMAAN
jgi:hypothetical protein